MLSIWKHEMKTNSKNLIIWSLAVGMMGMFCIMLFSSMEDSMAEMADKFSSMGAFSDAFGMSSLSVGTLTGFFATEIGAIHSLGGAMYAACMATIILSKEEDAHTGEFLYTLPVSRFKVVVSKLLAVVGCILSFTLLCVVQYGIGFAVLGESIDMDKFALFIGMQFLMDMEIAAICFCLSAFTKTNKMGIGLGLALLLYTFDLIGRVIPDMKDYIWIGPFSYGNATDLFVDQDFLVKPLIAGCVVMICAMVVAFYHYVNKDLAS